MKSTYQIIIDSGATKTEFVLLKDNVVAHQFFATGINANYTKDDEIENIFNHFIQSLPLEMSNIKPYRIVYYGAGCASEKNSVRIASIILRLFPQSAFNVFSDLLAGCHAFCNQEPGIVAILGTGSSSCYYDGKKIVKRAPSLGYMIGDEGSGTHLGKKLITEYLSERLPSHLAIALENEFNLTPQKVIDAIYKKRYPNRFFASFAPFIEKKSKDLFVKQLCVNSFNDFFNNQISYYKPLDNLKIHIIGSVAFYFKDIISEVAQNQEIQINNIIASPIPSLIKYYHCNPK